MLPKYRATYELWFAKLENELVPALDFPFLLWAVRLVAADNWGMVHQPQ
jgi:hypothetical protein